MNTAAIVDKIEKCLEIRIHNLEKSLFEYDNTTPESILYLITSLKFEYGITLVAILSMVEQLTPIKLIEMINEVGPRNEYCNN